MQASESPVPATDRRLEQARAWLRSLDIDLQSDLLGITGDASARRYFRLTVDGQSRILMDAPPPGEDIRPFIDVAERLAAANLHAPEIIYADQNNGYLLLEDLGDDLYRDLLNEHTVDVHFPRLIEVLKIMAQGVSADGLPDYDSGLLQAEMDLFPRWYLGHHRSSVQLKQFDAAWGEFSHHIIESALHQPRCFVHRDYHSCNLLKTASNSIGIIDFQDAVNGPLNYDFISLIWDRYITWPRAQIEDWMEEFRLLLDRNVVQNIGPQQWQRYCDLMGLQRNFKVVGIFARLHYRDGKQGYIEMIPRFYRYLTDTLGHYPEFAEVLGILEQESCVP